MAVLVDGGSASASEILAGALSEHGVATLIGERTFGKGSVQELLPLSANASLKVTVARWHPPEGVSTSESGLTPDVEIADDRRLAARLIGHLGKRCHDDLRSDARRIAHRDSNLGAVHGQ